MQKELLAKLQNLTILYAEDEEGIRKNIADSLRYYVKEVYEAGDGQEAYDFDNKELKYKDTSVTLNKKEMLFFETLISNQNRITYYEELQDNVWIDDVMTDSALRSLVRNLRKKLPTDIIYNLSGVGYKFV